MSTPPRLGLDDFDRYGSLRPPHLLLLVVLFLGRHFISLFVGGISTFFGAGRGVDTSGLHAFYSNPWFFFASLPALTVAVAWGRRIPKAGKLIRSIWCHGRRWLLAAAALDLLLMAALAATGAIAFAEPHVVGAVLDLYCIAYLIRSKPLGQAFADFPAPGQEPLRGDSPAVVLRRMRGGR